LDPLSPERLETSIKFEHVIDYDKKMTYLYCEDQSPKVKVRPMSYVGTVENHGKNGKKHGKLL